MAKVTLTPEEIEEIIENKEKLSVRKAGEKYGVSKQTIFNIRRGMYSGVIGNKKYDMRQKLSEEDVKYIKENPENLNKCQLARKFGITRIRIYQILDPETYPINTSSNSGPVFEDYYEQLEYQNQKRIRNLQLNIRKEAIVRKLKQQKKK